MAEQETGAPLQQETGGGRINREGYQRRVAGRSSQTVVDALS